jgi:hypothetical protein
VIGTIPLPFLLTVPNSTEVIDFLQQSSFNFDSFAVALLSCGELLFSAIGTWLQGGEQLAKSSLELILTLAQFPEAAGFEFGCVKPFLDGSFSPEIRGLAIDILMQVESDRFEMYVQMLLEIFYHEDGSPTICEVLHDICIGHPDIFRPVASQIIDRAVQLIEVPGAAVLLADLSENLDGLGKARVVEAIVNQEILCIERVDAIFRILQHNGVELAPEWLLRLITELGKNESEEVLQCLSEILKTRPDFVASSIGQEQLLAVMQREEQFALIGFNLCLKCCADVPLNADLMEAFHIFANHFGENFDEELGVEVSMFLNKHQ